MVDEAKQEQEFEPTPYNNAYRKDLDKPDETETVAKEDTEKATPQETTSFLSSEKQTTQQEHDFKKVLKNWKSLKSNTRIFMMLWSQFPIYKLTDE